MGLPDEVRLGDPSTNPSLENIYSEKRIEYICRPENDFLNQTLQNTKSVNRNTSRNSFHTHPTIQEICGISAKSVTNFKLDKEITNVFINNLSTKNERRCTSRIKTPMKLSSCYKTAITQGNYKKLQSTQSLPMNFRKSRQTKQWNIIKPISLESYPNNLKFMCAAFKIPHDSAEAQIIDPAIPFLKDGELKDLSEVIYNCDYKNVKCKEEPRIKFEINYEELIKTQRDRCKAFLDLVNFILLLNLMSCSDFKEFKSCLQKEILEIEIIVFKVVDRIMSSQHANRKFAEQMCKTLRVRIGHVVNKFLQLKFTKAFSTENGRFLFQYFVDKMKLELDKFLLLT